MRVVDFLEKVYVAQDKRQGIVVPDGAGDLRLEHRLELAVVDEAGEAVVRGEVLGLLVKLEFDNGEAGRRCDAAEQVAVRLGESVFSISTPSEVFCTWPCNSSRRAR